jgi:putative Mn2+ efflux pump MntP
MTGDKGAPLVRSRWRFVVGGIAGISLTALLILGGFVEELLSGYIAALPGVIGLSLLVMGLKRSR